MKILIINPILFTPEKGVIPKVNTIKDTMIHSLCLGFAKNGHNVTLIASEDYRPSGKESYDFEVIFLKSFLSSVFKPSLIPYPEGLRSYLKEYGDKFDVVISSETFSIGSLVAAEVLPEKLIIWQEMAFHQHKFFRLPSKLWHNVIVKLFMRRVQLVVPRSVFAQKFIRKYFTQVSDTVVEHGIDIEKFEFSDCKKRQLITSSQLVYRKNIDGIIKKFSRLHELEAYSDVRLLIAGRGNQENKLKELVKTLGLDDYVDFLGFLPQRVLNKYIKESMGFLINTRKDINIVSIPESIVSGTPILTNSIPTSIRYIQENELGIVCDDWDVDELSFLIDNNDKFIEACRNYRDKLTNIGVAQMFEKLWDNH